MVDNNIPQTGVGMHILVDEPHQYVLLQRDRDQRLFPVKQLRGMQGKPTLVSAATTGAVIGAQLQLSNLRLWHDDHAAQGTHCTVWANKGIHTSWVSRRQELLGPPEGHNWDTLLCQDTFVIILGFLTVHEFERIRCCAVRYGQHDDP
jgi:hypothetical protein